MNVVTLNCDIAAKLFPTALKLVLRTFQCVYELQIAEGCNKSTAWPSGW